MHILLLEDDTIQLNAVKTILTKYDNSLLINCVQNYTDAINAIQSSAVYDAFILDIKLANSEIAFDGLQIASHIRSKTLYKSTPILFVTSLIDKIETCVNDIHCYSYIRKPYNEQDLIKAIASLNTSTSETKQFLSFKILNSVNKKINIDDILYVESSKRNIIIHTYYDDYKTGSYSLSELKERFNDSFLQTHNKYIVNPKYITYHDKSNSVVNIGKIIIPIGRAYKDSFEQNFY